MNYKKIDDKQYEITVYDWIGKHDDYVAGHVSRVPDSDEDSDLRYWMFYPIGGTIPMNCGDIRRIFNLISELNLGKHQ